MGRILYAWIYPFPDLASTLRYALRGLFLHPSSYGPVVDETIILFSKFCNSMRLKSLPHTQSTHRTGTKQPLIFANLTGIGHQTPSLLLRLSRKSRLRSPTILENKSQSTIHCCITNSIQLTGPSRILTAIGRLHSDSQRATVPMLPTIFRRSRSTVYIRFLGRIYTDGIFSNQDFGFGAEQYHDEHL